MNKRELAEFYLDRVLEDIPNLPSTSAGAAMMALIRACDDLQREAKVLNSVLVEFVETDSGRALSAYRKALNAFSPAPIHEDAVSRPEREGWDDAPEDAVSWTSPSAPSDWPMATSDPSHRDPAPDEVPSTELPGNWDASDFSAGVEDYTYDCPNEDGTMRFRSIFVDGNLFVCDNTSCGYREVR